MIDDLANPRKFIRFGHPPVAIDILPGIDGVDFDEAWSRRVEGTIDKAASLTAFSFPEMTSSSQNLLLGGPAILQMWKKSVKQRSK
jgi:hypothetical protein